MIGAGVFAAFTPAAAAAGPGLLIGLLLAALYPESGGAYVYGRKQLSRFWGFIAGWAFVLGKRAS